MRLSEKELAEILERGNAKIRTETSLQTTNMELSVGSTPVEKKKIAGFTAPVNIRVHSIRKRLTDPDGASIKAVLDSIVKAGILIDDGPKYIKKISFSQEKAKGREEETIITIEVL
jgi:hypothetical protein